MADTTNSIDILINDQVAPEIAPKLIAIGDAAEATAGKLGTLKSQLAGINGSNLSRLLKAFNDTGAGAVSLANQSTSLSAQVRATGSASDATAASFSRQAKTSRAAKAALLEHTEAARSLAGALAEERINQDAINQAVAAGVAEFDSIIAESIEYNASIARLAATSELNAQATRAMSEQQAVWGSTLAESSAALEAQGVLWQSNVQSMQEAAVQQSILTGATTELAEAEGLLANATIRKTATTVEDTIAGEENAAATLNQGEAYATARIAGGAMAGSTNMMLYGFARLASSVPLVSAALSAAFPIIIAAAMVEVIYQVVAGLYKMIQTAENAAHNISIAFDSIVDPLRKTNDTLAVTNDKLDATISKLEHKPTTNGAQLAIDEARQSADKLDDSLLKVNNDLDKILTKNRIGIFQSILTGQGTTGDTEQFIKKQFDVIDEARKNAQQNVDKATAIKDPKASAAATVAAYQSERAAIQGTITALNDKYNALSKLQDQHNHPKQTGISQYGAPVYAYAPDQTANLTSVGKSVQLAQEDMRGLDLTMANIGKNTAVDHLRDQTSALKNETKEAAKEWKNLQASYVAFQRTITDTGHKPTAQQKLGFLVGKESSINPLNANKLQAQEQPLRNDIAGQQFGQDQIAKLSEQAKNIDKYGSALKEATLVSRIFQEAQQKGLSLTDDQKASIVSLASVIEKGLPLQQQETKLWKEATQQETDYHVALQAAAIVMHDHPELASAISREVNKMTIAYNDNKDPLFEFNRGIAQAKSLLNQYGDQLEVSQKVQALGNELRSKGVTNWQESAEAQRGALTVQLQEQQAQKASEALYNRTTDAINRQNDARDALKKAPASELSSEAKQSALVNNRLDTNSANLATGQASDANSIIGGAIGSYAKGFTTLADSIQKTMAPAFKTLADGFADSIGRAIVYSHNLGQALKDVARSAVAELISGLIKAATEMLIIKTLGAAFGFSGGGSVGAGGILKMFGFSQGGLVQAFAGGGSVWGAGTATSDSIPAMLSHGEYVMNASAASVYRPLLDAMNSGTPTQGTPQGSSGGNGRQMKVEVHNHGGASVQVQQMDENHVRLIVRDEAPKLIVQHAPAVIAGDLNNPNSKTSKAVYRNVTPSRVR